MSPWQTGRSTIRLRVHTFSEEGSRVCFFFFLDLLAYSTDFNARLKRRADDLGSLISNTSPTRHRQGIGIPKVVDLTRMCG